MKFLVLFRLEMIRRLRDPLSLIIWLAIPFALTGALMALFIVHLINGMTISVNALIGVVMLVGIVVNNAIVLMDYVRRGQESGLKCREALIKAVVSQARAARCSSCPIRCHEDAIK